MAHQTKTILKSIISVLIHWAVQATEVQKNLWGALFASFLALWWVTELQVLQKGKTETVAENKKERVRRKGTKGRKRDGNRQERVGERETERESWHCHFRSARQPTLCHHDNGEMSYPAGKQGCPRRRREGKVVMRKKEQERQGKKNRAMEGSKWMKSESLRIYLWERKIERDRDRQIKVAGVTAMVAKATEAVKTLYYLAERNLLASTNAARQ